MSLSHFAPLAAVAISGSAFAGIVGGSAGIDSMQVGRGYVDFQDPSGGGASTATIANPPVGSLLLLGGGIPNVERFLSVLEFTSAETDSSGSLSTFDFRNELEVDPFEGPEFEFAFAGNRLEFTTAGSADFSFTASLDVSGGGAMFVYNYSTGALILVDESYEEVNVTVLFDAGTHTIAWGVLAGTGGGFGDLEGTATLFVVPAPGVAALLAMAGLVLGHRRRR
jgi:hypothetical protein